LPVPGSAAQSGNLFDYITKQRLKLRILPAIHRFGVIPEMPKALSGIFAYAA
jgi:hypothetical protein